MRLPWFLLAGILLLVATFLLTGLFAQPPSHQVGAIAAAVFLPLWYAIAAINAWIGVVSAGYRLVAEAVVMLAVFGIPGTVAALGWWASVTWWDGGPVVHTGRAPVVLAAGLALWGAVVVLTRLLAPQPSVSSSAATGAAVFLPFWFLVCLVNLVVGVLAQGYTVLEEIPVLLLNLAVPTAVAVLAWRTTARRRASD